MNKSIRKADAGESRPVVFSCISLLMRDAFNENGTRIIHLRFGIIVTDHKHCRFVIARIDTEKYPLVFLREWEEDEDPEEGYVRWFSLYREALTAAEADEILGLLENDEKLKANRLLKRYFKPQGVLCEFANIAMLNKAVPIAWFEVWKETESWITSRRDRPGYYETHVEELY